ncbi:hypothetical protein [Nocardioides alpinus]|uniref:hypothetical protein n=1 Tax=Nocardioides alpinus TaxID=748909 RepID=UPI001113E2E3|nr:hypothetical protein [Nocardioides alpinus]
MRLRLECRTSPDGEAGVAHELTLYPDWSMRAQHDLEADRVAAAFGGYTSCLRLEAPVTAANDGLELLARRVPADGPWTVGGLDETEAVTQSLGPAPDGGPLEIRVECRTSRTASRGKQHSVVIEPDWTVRTPHDLEAERVAAAFGGFTSCLELVDKVIPAVQSTLPLLLRRRLARLTRTKDERVIWSAVSVRGCRCHRGTFTSARDAATHLRSPAHLVKQYAVSPRPLTNVLAAVEGAWGGIDAPTAEARARADRVVREFRGSESLWAAGLHPEHVLEFAALAPGIDEPLPEAFFLGVAYSGVDVTWLTATVASRPETAGAAWLAWVPADKGSAYLSALQDWYSLGLSRRQIEALTIEGVSITAAEALARTTGRALRTGGADLAAWALAGCRPTVEHFQVLDQHGLGSTYSPSRAAVDRLVEVAQRYSPSPSRTELGVLLSLEGTQRGVEVQLERGIRSMAELIATHRRTWHDS